MEDHRENESSGDMASRIEKTLVDREQARMKESSVAKEVAHPERISGGSSYSGYVMLLLGVFVGAVIGAALYFVLPGPDSFQAGGGQPEIGRASCRERGSRYVEV